MLNGYLYIAWSDGTFDRRTFDGTTYGTPEAVNTSSQLTALTDWIADIKTMTGLFYDSGRLYFTKSGSSTLYYRYFTPESKVVGAQRLTASGNVTGIDFSQVRGMFVADGKLYWSTPSNDLRRLGWAQGAQSGTPGRRRRPPWSRARPSTATAGARRARCSSSRARTATDRRPPRSPPSPRPAPA